jgi:hypothetical protein
VLRFIPGLATVGEFIEKATDAFLDFIGVTNDQTGALRDQETQVQKLINAETRRLDVAKQTFSQRKRLLEAAGKDTAALQIEEEKFFRDQALRQIKFIESQLGLIKTVSATAFAGAKAEIQRLQDEVTNRTVEVTAIQIESTREAAEAAKKAREEQEKKDKEFTEKRLKEAKRIRDGLIAIQDDEDKARKEKEKKDKEQFDKDQAARLESLSRFKVKTLEELGEETLFRQLAAQNNIDIAALEQEGIFIKTQEGILALTELEKQYDLDRRQIITDYWAFVEENGDIAFEQYVDLLANQAAAQQATYDQQLQAALGFGQAVSGLFEQSLTETGLDLQKFNRGVITLLLDTLQKTVNAGLAEILVKQVAGKGFAGIATAAALSAGVNIAFGLAKAQINKPTPKAFATGVIGLEGAGTETSDSIPAYLSRGESVIPAWGTRAIQNMYPGFLENFVGSPKFRDGVIDFQPSVTPQTDGNRNLIDAIRLLPAPIVRVADINKGQNDYAEVRLSGTI